MKIAIVTRKNEAHWAGDLKALYCFYEGLKEIGQDVIMVKTVEECMHVDFIFLSNTAQPLTDSHNVLRKANKRFGVIGFHGDRSTYYSPCYGFAHFVGLCLAQQDGFSFYHLDQLLENPDIIGCFPYTHPAFFDDNFTVLDNAEICIATSHTEASIMKRDSPQCNAKTIYLECGISDEALQSEDKAFLQWTGLKKGEYVLQIGRIELRKNQLGSILAMRDLDMPLVFIATEAFYPKYEEMCINAIKKYRSAPTFIISQNLENRKEDNVHILKMPHKEKLPFSMLISAYQNAGLHLHPAFCELPGLTYLEAAKLNIPTVASNWTTIADYFTDHVTKEYTLDDRIVYCPPHHINEITSKISQYFGKKINAHFSHPIFQRTRRDAARDLLDLLLTITN